MTFSRTASLLAIALATATLLGCAMPHITVHDDPLSPSEHLQLGVSYEERGELDIARKQYEMATDLPEAWFYLGNVDFRQQRWEAAEIHYRRAIRKMPEDPRPLNNLAWMLLTRNDRLDEAETLARHAVELAPAVDAPQFRDTLDAILEAKSAPKLN